MKSRTLMIIFFVIVNTALIAATIWWLNKPEPLAFHCQGQLNFNESRDNNPFDFDGAVVMHFNPDGSGYFTMNGKLTEGQMVHPVSRQENFNWRNLHDSLYEISIKSVERFSHDRVPDKLFEAYTAGILLGQKRLLSIQRTPEHAIIIGNFYSPLLLCAS
ncbi:hypothetical protein [Pseudocitrobacter cyperus]|uniref:FidL-like membrane protein n=1 Tax=Pseudocitrobacter cyperus TaxID=3112843 RepID=A0ABV0HPK0_9ENTR